MDNLNPKWKTFKIALSSLCNGDSERPIKVEILDWESDGNHKFIGRLETTFN